MKIVKYIGGLGNQMFIYAFSVALRETFRQEILVDTPLLSRLEIIGPEKARI